MLHLNNAATKYTEEALEDVPTIAAGSFTDTYFSADLPLPAEFTTGISYKASDVNFRNK